MPFPKMPKDWPHRSFVRRVTSPPHDWCVVDEGSGPVVLLLHGAGGSGHSFRHLIPQLTPFYRVIVPDLPGHGFTRTQRHGRLGLDEMATDLSALCVVEGWNPVAIIGHSAGGAIALRMAELGTIPAGCVIGVNAALGEFEGAAGVLFPLMARVLAMLPLLPTMISKLWGTPARVDALLAGTGSKIETDGRRQYLHLVQDAHHIEGTLGMMAQWQLTGLLARLPMIAVPVLLIASAGDRAVPASVSARAGKRIRNAEVVVLPNLGHLAHEEAAAEVARVAMPWLARQIGAGQSSQDTLR
jgi:magnesium chelatase accessory protein